MLFVLRHGESTWNAAPSRCQGQLDVPLSERGRAEAVDAAADLPFPDAAYSSHLSRARETAELILAEQERRAGHAAPRLLLDERLAEADCGEWQGRLHEAIKRDDPDRWQALIREEAAFEFPGGERLDAVLRRFSAAIEEIRRRHRGERVLVVTHGGPMRLFLTARGLLRSPQPGMAPRNLEGFTLAADGLELRTRPQPPG